MGIVTDADVLPGFQLTTIIILSDIWNLHIVCKNLYLWILHTLSSIQMHSQNPLYFRMDHDSSSRLQLRLQKPPLKNQCSSFLPSSGFQHILISPWWDNIFSSQLQTAEDDASMVQIYKDIVNYVHNPWVVRCRQAQQEPDQCKKNKIGPGKKDMKCKERESLLRGRCACWMGSWALETMPSCNHVMAFDAANANAVQCSSVQSAILHAVNEGLSLWNLNHSLLGNSKL